MAAEEAPASSVLGEAETSPAEKKTVSAVTRVVAG